MTDIPTWWATVYTDGKPHDLWYSEEIACMVAAYTDDVVVIEVAPAAAYQQVADENARLTEKIRRLEQQPLTITSVIG